MILLLMVKHYQMKVTIVTEKEEILKSDDAVLWWRVFLQSPDHQRQPCKDSLTRLQFILHYFSLFIFYFFTNKNNYFYGLITYLSLVPFKYVKFPPIKYLRATLTFFSVMLLSASLQRSVLSLGQSLDVFCKIHCRLDLTCCPQNLVYILHR